MVAPMRLAVLVILLSPCLADAVEYYCPITKKWDLEQTYSAEQIEKWKFAVKIEETKDGTYLSRCSHVPAEDKLSCDRYAVDRVEYDENVSIKKYYVFRSQFDVQLFRDLSMLENNGRGGMATGKCTVTSP